MADITEINGSLDNSFYIPSEDEKTFFRSQTGIQDDDELKAHFMKIRREAYQVFPYPCVANFHFTCLKIPYMPVYQQVLKLGREREGAVFLDIGCCFGVDLRKTVADGFPIQNVIGSDLHAGFLDLGHKLLKTTPETFPARLIAGDALDPAFIPPTDTGVPFYVPPTTPKPTLADVTSFAPLRGHVSAIYASLFFHLFDEAQQAQLAHRLAGLLSPEPGSILFGCHGGLPEKGFRTEAPCYEDRTRQMFCHSPESWKALWDGEVFKKGTVKVEAAVTETVRKDQKDLPEARWWTMFWSVTRL